MARTIAEIKNEITDAWITESVVRETYGLSNDATFAGSFSKVSLESILFYVIAVAVWTVEKLVDKHKAVITAMLALQRPHTLTRVRDIALAYRDGQELLTDSDQYSNAGLSDEAIAKMQIVKCAAVTEPESASGLILKIAGETNGVLSPLPAEQLSRFKGYFAQVKYAGVKTTIINAAADRLVLEVRVWVNPVMFNDEGMNLIEGTYPIHEAIQAYMRELPFNGELVLAHLIDKLQSIDGVLVPHIDRAVSSQVEAGAQTADGYGELTPIDVRTIPYSGYFAVTFIGDYASKITIEK